MNLNWNIGFEWVVTGAAVIGVIVLLVSGGNGESSDAPSLEVKTATGSR